jgi:hypothetical protein
MFTEGGTAQRVSTSVRAVLSLSRNYGCWYRLVWLCSVLAWVFCEDNWQAVCDNPVGRTRSPPRGKSGTVVSGVIKWLDA